MGNILCFCAFAVVNTIMLVINFDTVYLPTPTGDGHVREAMAVKTMWCLFFELVIWDTIFMPLFIAAIASVNKSAAKFFSCLNRPLDCGGKKK